MSKKKNFIDSFSSIVKFVFLVFVIFTTRMKTTDFYVILIKTWSDGNLSLFIYREFVFLAEYFLLSNCVQNIFVDRFIFDFCIYFYFTCPFIIYSITLQSLHFHLCWKLCTQKLYNSGKNTEIKVGHCKCVKLNEKKIQYANRNFSQIALEQIKILKELKQWTQYCWECVSLWFFQQFKCCDCCNNTKLYTQSFCRI